ncbi:MAG: FAD-dependent thymidylate synthase [Candidatus Micrarchaeota archaeon]
MTTPSELTEEEKKVLTPFMTNTDKNIFVLINLPEVVKGAMFSRYSRSTKSLRRVLLDEFILKPETGFKEIVNMQETKNTGANQFVAIKKAEEFYDRVLVGYGDDSVAELAGAHVAIEDVSIIATKFLEDSRIGLSPLEKSTRYVYFDQKRNGKWLYLEEQKIMASEFASLYKETCDMLFQMYADLIPKISDYITKKYPKEAGVSDRAYASTVRAKVCDIIRGLLPASTITNMGFFGDGRAYEYLLTKLYANELSEAKTIASTLGDELKKVIPSFVKRAEEKYGREQQAYLAGIESKMFEISKKYENVNTNHVGAVSVPHSVKLVEYEQNAETKVVEYILYSYLSLSIEQIREIVQKMSSEEKSDLINKYAGTRANRRHKPGRALENIFYTFDVLANYGAFRDLHRHRILTQQRQLLSCDHGYTMPKEIIEAGFEKEFRTAMEKAKTAYDKIAKVMPQEAQYVVPLAYNIRYYMKMNLREAIHFCELRSMAQGHIDYRLVAQDTYKEIAKIHPIFANYFNFMDMKEYGLERLEAEKKIDKKLEEIDKKYAN